MDNERLESVAIHYRQMTKGAKRIFCQGYPPTDFRYEVVLVETGEVLARFRREVDAIAFETCQEDLEFLIPIALRSESR